MFSDILSQLKVKSIHHLSLNSKMLDAHTAFVALPGTQHHGFDFIDAAIAAGCPCVLIDANESFTAARIYPSHFKVRSPLPRVCGSGVQAAIAAPRGEGMQESLSVFESASSSVMSIEVIRVPQLQAQLGYFAAAFYGNPSSKIALHAITGTNGKTSCSQFIAQALKQINIRCGVIGTLGMGIWPELTPSLNTTPDAITLQRFLADCVLQDIKHVVMEASSIALAADRMQGCILHSALFTQLTQDHLDYHHTMEQYAAAKKRLFDFQGLRSIIINADDAFGRELLTQKALSISCWATSTNEHIPTTLKKTITTACQKINVRSTQFSQAGIAAEVTTPQGMGILSSPLLGAFNLENLLLILAWLLEYGLALPQALSIIQQLKSPMGRMQTLAGKHQPLVVIDYAHTPDALEKVLQALRTHCHGRLWCVFGCGGNRDVTKRPLMGAIAERLADYLIVTTDNPRDEEPASIAAQILSEPAIGKSEIILDRTDAIYSAITRAQEHDIVLIAGKGHEAYQEIKGQRFYFDDYACAQNILHSA